MRTKKKLFAAALAICLLSTISFSTLAWFNASESVTNKFMVATTGSGSGGSGSTPAEKVFSVDVWENVDTDNNGVKELVAYRDAITTGGNYENILPGVAYHKEPVVENTGSYDQYIRVVVTLSDAGKWIKESDTDEGVLPVGYDLGTIFLGHDDKDVAEDGDPVEWIRADETIVSGDSIGYVYYLNRKLAPGQTAVLFEQVKLPEHLTQDDIAKLVDADGTIDFDISIRADAIQTSLGENAEEAFNAIGADGWKASESYEEAMAPANP